MFKCLLLTCWYDAQLNQGHSKLHIGNMQSCCTMMWWVMLPQILLQLAFTGVLCGQPPPKNIRDVVGTQGEGQNIARAYFADIVRPQGSEQMRKFKSPFVINLQQSEGHQRNLMLGYLEVSLITLFYGVSFVYCILEQPMYDNKQHWCDRSMILSVICKPSSVCTGYN